MYSDFEGPLTSQTQDAVEARGTTCSCVKQTKELTTKKCDLSNPCNQGNTIVSSSCRAGGMEGVKRSVNTQVNKKTLPDVSKRYQSLQSESTPIIY